MRVFLMKIALKPAIWRVFLCMSLLVVQVIPKACGKQTISRWFGFQSDLPK
jgi:hypothetical protein